MNILENYYMQLFQKHNLLIDEQNPIDDNPLFKFITPPSNPPSMRRYNTGGDLEQTAEGRQPQESQPT
jgi:hypothetical protein